MHSFTLIYSQQGIESNGFIRVMYECDKVQLRLLIIQLELSFKESERYALADDQTRIYM